MTNRIRILAAVAATLTAVLAAPAAQADEPGCILGICPPPGQPVPPPPPAPIPAPPVPIEPPDPPNVVKVAEDHRPCVAAIEYRSAVGMVAHGTASRAKVEARWEVSGLGVRRNLGPIGTAYIYPRCGYRPSDAYYAAAYDRGQLVAAAAWKADGAIISGRP